jgi:ribosome-associated protein
VTLTKETLSAMIVINRSISIDEGEIQQDFVRSSGPGGQNVNKVATAVQLRFDVQRSPSLPGDVRQRLIRLAGRQMTDDGVLIINARQYRSQERNRQDAMQRLIDLIRRAAEKPKPRHKTRPTLASKARRLESKRRHAETKRARRYAPGAE